MYTHTFILQQPPKKQSHYLRLRALFSVWKIHAGWDLSCSASVSPHRRELSPGGLRGSAERGMLRTSSVTRNTKRSITASDHLLLLTLPQQRKARPPHRPCTRTATADGSGSGLGFPTPPSHHLDHLGTVSRERITAGAGSDGCVLEPAAHAEVRTDRCPALVRGWRALEDPRFPFRRLQQPNEQPGIRSPRPSHAHNAFVRSCIGPNALSGQ